MNVFTRCLQTDWAERMGWTLLHSLWQIALVAAACVVVSWLSRNRSAGIRYVTGCAALLMMLGLPVGTYVLLSHDSSPASTEVGNPRALTEPSDETMPPPSDFAWNDTMAVDPLNPIAPPEPLASEMGYSSDATDLAETNPITTNPITTNLATINLSSALRPWLPRAAVVWLMGVLLLLLRPLWGWIHVRRLQRHGLLPLSDTLRRVGERLADRLGVKRAVRFAQSTLVEVPAVVGHLRPMVLLPASAVTGLSVAEIELILIHELAHVRRHDSLVNLAQTLIEALLFYHPGMWWISNRIRKERENCCDDIAVAVSGNRAGYLRALARLEEQRSTAPIAVLAASGGSLMARVRRLLGQPTNEFGYFNIAAGFAGLVAIGLVAATLAMNQAPGEDPENLPEEMVEEAVEAGGPGEGVLDHTERVVEAQQPVFNYHNLYQNAIEAEKSGDTDKTIEAYELLVEKSPQYRRLYARFLVEQGKNDEAIELYQAYYADNPLRYDVLADVSELHVAEGRFAEAIASRESYMTGTSMAVSEGRGKLLQLWRKTGSLEQAASNYVAVVKDKKTPSRKIVLARQMLADIALERLDDGEAKKQHWLALEEILPAKDEWAKRVHADTIQEFLARKWLDDAVRAYRRQPAPSLLSRLGVELTRAGRGEEMLALYREHLLTRPDEHGDDAYGAAHGFMGVSGDLIEQIIFVGQGASVVESLRARVSEEPKSPYLHKHLSYLLHRMKRYEEALNEFDEMIRLADKPSPLSYKWCGDLCARANLVDEAINYLEKALKTELTPEDLRIAYFMTQAVMTDDQQRARFKAGVLASLGRLYQQKKQWTDAERCFQAIVDLEPHGPYVNMQGAEAALAEIWEILDKENPLLEDFKDRIAKTPDDADLRREYAKALLAAGDPRAAVEQYRQLLKLSPDDLKLRRELARALNTAEDHDQAIEQYETVLAGATRNPRPGKVSDPITYESVLYELANVCNNAGRQEKLLAVYQSIFQPDTPGGKWTPNEHAHGRILRDMTTILANRSDYRAIVDLWVAHREPMKNVARDAIRENAARLDSLDPLIARLREIVNKNSNDFSARLVLGDTLLLDNKRQEAMMVYAELSKDASDDVEIHLNLADVYRNMPSKRIPGAFAPSLGSVKGEFLDLTIGEYEQALRLLKPGDYDYLHTLMPIATLNLFKGDKARAAEIYRELIRYEPGNIDHHRGLYKATDGKEGLFDKPSADMLESRDAALAKATQLVAEGRYPEAIAKYEEILAIRSTDVETMVALARAYQNSGEEAKALATFEKAHANRKWTGRDHGARSELIRIYEETKADDKLVALYTEQKDYSGLQRFYHDRKQPEKFQEYLRELLEEEPHNTRIWIYLAGSYLDSNNLVAAREVYERLYRNLASSTDKTYGASHATTVSDGFERLGEIQKAVQVLESTGYEYERDPDINDWSGKRLMRLYAKNDQFAKSLEICNLRLKKDPDGRRTVTIAQEIAALAADHANGPKLLDEFIKDIKGTIPGYNHNRFLGTVRAHRLANPATPENSATSASTSQNILTLLKEGRIVQTPQSARNLQDFLDQLATRAHTSFVQSYRDSASQVPAPNIERTEGPAFELLAECIVGRPTTLDITQQGHWALYGYTGPNKKFICAANGGVLCKIDNDAIFRPQNGYLQTLGRMMFEPAVGQHVVSMRSQIKMLEVVDDRGQKLSTPKLGKPRWSSSGQLMFYFGEQDPRIETFVKVQIETAVAVCTRWVTFKAPRLDHTEPISLENDGITIKIDPIEVSKRHDGQEIWQLPLTIRRSLGADGEEISQVRHEIVFVTADGKRSSSRSASGTVYSANHVETRVRLAVDEFDLATTSLELHEPAAIEIVPVVLTFRDIPILDR